MLASTEPQSQFEYVKKRWNATSKTVDHLVTIQQIACASVGVAILGRASLVLRARFELGHWPAMPPPTLLADGTVLRVGDPRSAEFGAHYLVSQFLWAIPALVTPYIALVLLASLGATIFVRGSRVRLSCWILVSLAAYFLLLAPVWIEFPEPIAWAFGRSRHVD